MEDLLILKAYMLTRRSRLQQAPLGGQLDKVEASNTFLTIKPQLTQQLETLILKKIANTGTSLYAQFELIL